MPARLKKKLRGVTPRHPWNASNVTLGQDKNVIERAALSGPDDTVVKISEGLISPVALSKPSATGSLE